MALEPEQEQLFAKVVETTRSVPREEREPFWLFHVQTGAFVDGNGDRFDVLEQDIDVLVNAGLLRIGQYSSSGSGYSFYVPPEGFTYYEEIKKREGEPVAAVEDDVRAHLDAADFRDAYPNAYARWREAADLLWGADSEQELSTIGHKCREAIQEFVTALVERHRPAEVNQDKAKTRDRLSAVIGVRQPELGEARGAVLDALFAYWTAVGNLIQRQEHAGQKEGEPLVWEDGRRVVFQTAFVMFEISRNL